MAFLGFGTTATTFFEIFKENKDMHTNYIKRVLPILFLHRKKFDFEKF